MLVYQRVKMVMIVMMRMAMIRMMVWVVVMIMMLVYVEDDNDREEECGNISIKIAPFLLGKLSHASGDHHGHGCAEELRTDSRVAGCCSSERTK